MYNPHTKAEKPESKIFTVHMLSSIGLVSAL